jgi:hypothetical protein
MKKTNKLFLLIALIGILSVFSFAVIAQEQTEDPICNPKSYGFWKRICKEETHPEAPHPFFSRPCLAFLLDGKERSYPCNRAKAQLTGLEYNVMYGYLSEECEVTDLDGNITTVGEAIEEIRGQIPSQWCKQAADFAQSINSGAALI